VSPTFISAISKHHPTAHIVQIIAQWPIDVKAITLRNKINGTKFIADSDSGTPQRVCYGMNFVNRR
tara:strand:+ start:59 stop:256 length:198 start_codon:yes stop_codon:yes gene_type:complete